MKHGWKIKKTYHTFPRYAYIVEIADTYRNKEYLIRNGIKVPFRGHVEQGMVFAIGDIEDMGVVKAKAGGKLGIIDLRPGKHIFTTWGAD
jgi:hypothetical protein